MVDFTTKTGGRKKYNYAPLSEVIDAIRKALSDNALAIMQPTKLVEGKLIVETLLSHSSGEWVKGEILIESQSQDAQSQGSALTYARRYALSSLLGIASEEDDDAEGTKDKEAKVTPKGIETPAGLNQIKEEQYKRILVLAEEKGVSLAQIGKAYIKATFSKAQSKALTQDEASKMIEDLESGRLSEDWKPEGKLVKEAKNLGAEVIS